MHGQRYSILQKKHMRNSVPKCLCKLLQPANWPMAGSSSLEGHFRTGLRARFSSAWSNVECASMSLRVTFWRTPSSPPKSWRICARPPIRVIYIYMKVLIHDFTEKRQVTHLQQRVNQAQSGVLIQYTYILTPMEIHKAREFRTVRSFIIADIHNDNITALICLYNNYKIGGR